ncbi:hypothetical protein CHCC14821_2496 [Bacillus paralicheniformis]|nr:hypothetical protein CHCC14821_2496 [Bacillus paralicheniformis]TWM68478.1 hypothetical protein CHCC14814_0480 [Bacillus paralicheniformis]
MLGRQTLDQTVIFSAPKKTDALVFILCDMISLRTIFI